MLGLVEGDALGLLLGLVEGDALQASHAFGSRHPLAPHVALVPGFVMQSESGVHAEQPAEALSWPHAPQWPAGAYAASAVHASSPAT